MANKQLDNQTFTEKVALRREALSILREWGVTDPIVCETHGGKGDIWAKVYPHLEKGMVFETDGLKVRTLALQRGKTWRVYQADCVVSLEAGVGEDLTFDLLDTDPYGECWPVIDAFFGNKRKFADRMVIVVNDGLRQKLAMGGAWDVDSMRWVVETYGNDIHPIYLEVSEAMLRRKVAEVGYTVERFHGYHCGKALAMTHWMAILTTSKKT